MRNSPAPVNLDSYSWLTPIRRKPLPLAVRSQSSGIFSNGVQISPIAWKTTFREDEISVVSSADSIKFKRAQSLPSQVSGQPTVTSGVNLVNARRRLEIVAEIGDIRKSYEDNYKKYRSPKRINDFDLRYQHWKKYFDKRKQVYCVKITKEDFERFWEWFESRVDKHERNDGEISIDKLIDDFVYFGVVATKQEATHMLQQIDSDSSGTISFEELMSGMGTGDVSQMTRLKYFMSNITRMTNKQKEDLENSKGDRKSRRKGLLKKLRNVKRMPSVSPFDSSCDERVAPVPKISVEANSNGCSTLTLPAGDANHRKSGVLEDCNGK